MKTNFIHKLLSTILLFCLAVEARGLEEQVLFSEVNYNAKSWTEVGVNERESLREVVKFLRKSPYGEELWEKASRKAMEQGKDLEAIIDIGKSSFTDTSLIRRFDLKKPEQVDFHYRSVINLNGQLNFVEGVLDLAHELTHFLYRKSFNPYGMDFNLEDFIKNTVEGTGGEVDAYISECKVLYDLFPMEVGQKYFCRQVYNREEKTFSRELVISEFYKVGPQYGDFIKVLERKEIHQRFPYLSSAVGYFVSSVYGIPYPVAALKEFETIKSRSCQNDQGRIQLLRDKINTLDPSEQSHYEQTQSLARIEKSFFSRCNDI